jgi:ribosome-associated protein
VYGWRIAVINITPTFMLDEAEIKFSFMSSPGPGGQNVNKVATAVLLRFNVLQSASLPDEIRQRLLLLYNRKITRQGELIIKASRFRTQKRNKRDALDRLIQLLKQAAIKPKKRRKTKPTKASVQQRLEKKKVHAKKKLLRRCLDKKRGHI